MIDPIAYLTQPRWQTISLGLERTVELLERLGNPQNSLRFVHVAGTNGKGSTCSFVATIMQEAGYRTGLFTSPELYCFEDRIRVDGSNITHEALCEISEVVRSAAEQMDEHPSEFELLTAVAFLYFAKMACEIVVCEVGLGGRLDSTNVLQAPEVCAITPVSIDHCAYLGNTLAEIASEKAGIIKPGCAVVCAPQAPEVLKVITQAAQAAQAKLTLVDEAKLSGTPLEFSYRSRSGLSLSPKMQAPYQLVNAACALDVIDSLVGLRWEISEDAVRCGLAKATWAGRFEIVSEEPLIIFDGAHNVAGMQALACALNEKYPNHYKLVVAGVLEDKDYQAMAVELDSFANEIIAVAPPNRRALDAKQFANVLRSCDPNSEQVSSISSTQTIEFGVRKILTRAAYHNEVSPQTPALICVAGSLYLLPAVMEVLHNAGLAL